MKALNEYPTPLTDAAFALCSQALTKCGDSPALNGKALRFTADTLAGTALDLERKLSLCRDALAELIEGIDLLTPDAPSPIAGSVMANAKQALTATK